MNLYVNKAKPGDEKSLKYTVSAMCVVERILNKKLSEIIAELQSETGAGLYTLVTLTAAGLAPHNARLPAEMIRWHIESDARDAAGLVQAIGLEPAAKAVGVALSAFLAEIGREAA